MTKANYTLRFNLGRGENYLKWKLTNKATKTSTYHDDTTNFIMYNCKLKNSKLIASRIFTGQSKQVCAMVEFESYEMINSNITSIERQEQLHYNPKIAPCWTQNGVDVDNQHYSVLVTDSRKIYKGVDNQN